MNVTLTGYGPFLTNDTNPSGEIASLLHGKVLEVSYEAVDRFMEQASAEAFLCLGLNAKATSPRLEVRAYNAVSQEVQDVQGLIPKQANIEGNEECRATTIDIPELYSYLLEKGFPCSISEDAGRYLCNYIYFKALGKGKALFVHLPPLSQQWPLTRQKEFVEAILSWMKEQE